MSKEVPMEAERKGEVIDGVNKLTGGRQEEKEQRYLLVTECTYVRSTVLIIPACFEITSSLIGIRNSDV